MRRSMPHRKAARVLPLPVGARIRVWSPSAIAGHPWAWASVGAGKLDSNHALTGAENRSSAIPPTTLRRGYDSAVAVDSRRGEVRRARVASRLRGVLRDHLRVAG